MNESLKVQPHHLQRSAYLYVRQSSMRQVIENVESTKRQYALRNRATALGWRDDQIIVIDNDQGESGASAAWREGFQRLVTLVGRRHLREPCFSEFSQSCHQARRRTSGAAPAVLPSVDECPSSTLLG